MGKELKIRKYFWILPVLLFVLMNAVAVISYLASTRSSELSFSYLSSSEQIVTVYYHHFFRHGYSEENTAVNVYSAAGVEKNMDFQLPGTAALSTLRLDSGDKPGTVRIIGDIQLKNVVSSYRISPEHFRDIFTERNDVDSVEATPEWVQFTITGNDPYFVMDKGALCKFAQEQISVNTSFLGYMICIEVVLIFLLYLVFGNLIAKLRGFSEKSFESAQAWISGNKGWLLYSFVIILLSFTYEMFYFTNSSDDQRWLQAAPNAKLDWIFEGRWGMTLCNFMIENPSVPFFSLFLTMALMWIGFNFLTSKFNSVPGVRYIGLPLFLASPVLYFAFTYNTLAAGFGFGFCSGAMAIYCLSSGNKKLYIPGILLATFCMSVYQAFAVYLIVAGLFYILSVFIMQGSPLKDMFRRIVKIYGGLLLSLILYLLISKMLMFLMAQTIPDYLVGSMTIPDTCEGFIYAVRKSVPELLKYYKGSPEIFGSPLVFQFILLVSAILLFLYHVCKQQNTSAWKIAAVIFFIAILTVPFLFLPLLNFRLTRILLAVPLAVTGAAVFAYCLSGKGGRFILMALTLLCFMNYMYVNNRLAYVNYLNWEQDSVLASQILYDLNSTFADEISGGAQNIPLVVSGSRYGHPRSDALLSRESIGTSYFAWAAGDAGCVAEFFSVMGSPYYTAAGPAQYQHVYSQVAVMPSWPAKGSVANIGGVAVVKFGDFSHTQIIQKSLPVRILRNTFPDAVQEYDMSGLDKTEPLFRLDQLRLKESRHVVIDSENDSWNMNVTQPDPSLLFEGLQADSPYVVLEFGIDSDIHDIARFYCSLDDLPLKELFIRLDKGTNRFAIRLPGESLKAGFRFDPGTGTAKKLSLADLNIYAAD